jgi:DNA-binding GntR family transcriptional regulator
MSAGRVASGGNLGNLLDLSPRQEVWEIVFTHTLDDAPVSLSQMYLLIQGTLTVSAPPEFQSGGPDILQQLATRYGVDVTPASQFESDVLGVETGAPLIQVSSLDFSTKGRPGSPGPW